MSPSEQMDGRITITVNGQPRPTPAGASLADLLEELGLSRARVACERNRQLVPQASWPSCRLADGDHLEIVTLVGGG